jgi:ferredoxin/ferredoxin-NADP reductase
MAKIKFRCSPPVEVEAGWDETVLDALLRSGMPVPFFCRSGICGECKSQLAAGELVQIGTAPAILSQAEVDAKLVLICRSIAVTDCEIVPQHLTVANDELPWPTRVQVVEAGWLGASLFHFRTAADRGAGAATFLFRPGQYTYLQAPSDADWDLPSRMYPATRPGHDFIDFNRTPAGPRQARSMKAAFRVGAGLQLARPVGASCLKEADRGAAILVASSVGLPAMLSMVELLRMRDDRSGLHVVVRGRAEDRLESEVASACAGAGIDLQFRNDDDIRAALEAVARAVTAEPARSGRRAQAYVKGDERLVRMSREVFYACGLKPWEVHAETLEGTDWTFLS